MRRGVWLLLVGVVAASLAATSSRADGPSTSTTGTTTTTATPSYARLTPSYLRAGCVGAGAAVIAEPARRVLALGTPASDLGSSAYPAKAPVVTFDSSTASGSTCKTAEVTLESVSLFGGFVTATSVDATHGRGTVGGLEIGGSPVTLTAGEAMPLGYWGQLTLGRRVGRLAGPLVVELLRRHWSLPAGTAILVAFTATAQPVDRSSHSSSRTTTTTTPAAGSTTQGQPARTKKHRHPKKKQPQPLKRTPPLGFRPSHYVFPVDGGASYVDTYGANRSDIYDGWHHGDDLFAPLGTALVAVANGTLSLVGWNKLGGWRLWLTDGDGNSFYYAHLAGYSRWVLKHPHVRAGQVVGFLGRTGDAFTTTPHLHFEIHPHQYLKLGYDGAVDPTAYLHKWRIVRVPANEMPQPAKLKAPRGAPAQEASVVWRELLAARHLLPATVPVGPRMSLRPFPRPRSLEDSGASQLGLGGVQRTAAQVPVREKRSDTRWVGAGLAGALVLLSAGAFTFRRRRRTPGDISS